MLSQGLKAHNGFPRWRVFIVLREREKKLSSKRSMMKSSRNVQQARAG
jgi:hypothetical protein